MHTKHIKTQRDCVNTMSSMPIRAAGGGIGSPEAFGDMLKRNAPIIIGLLIFIVLGVVILSVMSGMGYYILGVLNSTGVTIPSNVNFLSNITGTMPGVISLLLVAMIIAVIAFILMMLMQTASSAQTWAGGGF